MVRFFLQHCDEHCSSTLRVTFLHPHIHPRVGLYSARAELFFRYRVSRCAESPLWGLLQSASCSTVNIATVNIFFFQLWILLLTVNMHRLDLLTAGRSNALPPDSINALLPLIPAIVVNPGASVNSLTPIPWQWWLHYKIDEIFCLRLFLFVSKTLKQRN